MPEINIKTVPVVRYCLKMVCLKTIITGMKYKNREFNGAIISPNRSMMLMFVIVINHSETVAKE